MSRIQSLVALCIALLFVSVGSSCTEDRGEGMRPWGEDLRDVIRGEDDQAGLTGEGEAAGQEEVEPMGWSRARVMELQTSLQERGYDPGPIDGIIGPQTREALRRFQADNDLAATGDVDDETLYELGMA